jgi:ABC-2 type transport system ATP-binding protein
VLILDEPTDGLDPNQKHEIRTLIKRMGEHKAIIFSTHILEEVDAVCSRAVIIDRGRIVANGTPAELRGRSEYAGAVVVRVKGAGAEEVSGKLEQINAVKRVALVKQDDTGVTVRAFPKSAKDGDLARDVALVVTQAGWKTEELHTEEGRLDEVFRSITLPDTVKEGAK